MKITHAILPILPAAARKKLIRSQLPVFYRSIPGVTFRKTVTPDEQEACLRLVNSVYVSVGYAPKATDTGFGHLRKVPHHDNPETAIFMATSTNRWQEEIPIYTASLFPDGSMGLPADSGFKKQIDTIRQQGHHLVEVGCLASHPDYRRNNKRIPMAMNYLLVKTILNELAADTIVITIHPNYLKIYKDILLFKPIGEIKNFSYVNGNPAVALYRDIPTWPQELRQAYSKMSPEKNLCNFFFGE